MILEIWRRNQELLLRRPHKASSFMLFFFLGFSLLAASAVVVHLFMLPITLFGYLFEFRLRVLPQRFYAVGGADSSIFNQYFSFFFPIFFFVVLMIWCAAVLAQSLSYFFYHTVRFFITSIFFVIRCIMNWSEYTADSARRFFRAQRFFYFLYQTQNNLIIVHPRC